MLGQIVWIRQSPGVTQAQTHALFLAEAALASAVHAARVRVLGRRAAGPVAATWSGEADRRPLMHSDAVKGPKARVQSVLGPLPRGSRYSYWQESRFGSGK